MPFAFDEDDSGRSTLQSYEMRCYIRLLIRGETLSERDVDRVMNGFTGRRAFSKNASGMAREGGI